MAKTTIQDVQNQVQKFWSPLMTKELRASQLLGSLVSKEYEGEIRRGGDTVYVSQINAPVGENRTIGVDADSFTSEKLSTSRIAIQANKRAVASFEFEDLVDLQSQIGSEESAIRDSLRFTVEKQINDYLYSVAAPAVAHTKSGVNAFTADELLAARQLASEAKWLRNKNWYCLTGPGYYNDLLKEVTLTSADRGATDAPVIAGQIAKERFGFTILEDNSRAADFALMFHPDFMHLCMQKSVEFKVSDLHAQNKFGYVVSADVIYGAAMGIAGDKKCIKVTA